MGPTRSADMPPYLTLTKSQDIYPSTFQTFLLPATTGFWTQTTTTGRRCTRAMIGTFLAFSSTRTFWPETSQEMKLPLVFHTVHNETRNITKKVYLFCRLLQHKRFSNVKQCHWKMLSFFRVGLIAVMKCQIPAAKAEGPCLVMLSMVGF